MEPLRNMRRHERIACGAPLRGLNFDDFRPFWRTSARRHSKRHLGTILEDLGSIWAPIWEPFGDKKELFFEVEFRGEKRSKKKPVLAREREARFDEERCANKWTRVRVCVCVRVCAC